MLNRRRALMTAQGGATPILPSAYQQVEYIEAAGAKSYIKTGIAIKSNSPTIKMTYYKATQASAESALFFAQDSNNAIKIEIGFNGTTNRLFAYSSSSAQIISPIVYGNVVDVEVNLQTSSPYITMTAKSGSTTESANKTTANASALKAGLISLFASRTGTTNVYARIYKCEVWDDGTLTAQFIPCYRKSDNVVGMYETVFGNFYDSETENPFQKGGNV